MRQFRSMQRTLNLHRIVTLLAALVLLALTTLVASAGVETGVLWTDVAERTITVRGERLIIPAQYRVVTLNQAMLRDLLARAPLEGASTAPLEMSLPLPDGTLGRFGVIESPIMAAGLAAKYPEIKTYAGRGIDDPTATVRFDRTPLGFHAMILSARGTIYIDPYSRNDVTHYISYDTRDFTPLTPKTFSEGGPSADDLARAQEIAALIAQSPHTPVGPQLRTYRLAVGATGEYTVFNGGTVASGLAAVVTSVNRVDGIYEREVAVRMVLVANNNLVIYTNPNTDPYTNGSPSSLLSENQATLDSVIGSANYDIGHVFSTAGGGLAQLGVPCRAGQKAHGETGTSSPVGDPFDVDYVAHEMGHQFGGNHTFNGTAGSCNGNRAASAAYEPGSASTIMGYAGICGTDDLQPHSDDYFHTKSFDEIVAYTVSGFGNTCAVVTNTGNTAPVPNAGASYTIPAQTPFTLTGSASDADGDTLTYNWEEYDLGNAGPPNNPTNPPFFRSFLATASPARTFPKWSDIISNTTTIGEILPNITRAMVFRLTARDNHGGVDWRSTTINVTTAAGPFQVTAPNTATTWIGSTTQNVTWNVANTSAAPVSCATVDLRLSIDGGYTYPFTLASGVANNGSATVTAPAVASTTARVQVACAGNIFFDISNVNFTILSDAALADLAISQRATPEPVAAGHDLTYTMTITNAGPGVATLVSYSDAVPANTTFVSLVASGWTCTTPIAGGSGAIGCSRPVLSSTVVSTLTLIVHVNPNTPEQVVLNHTASVSSTSIDQNSANNTSNLNSTLLPQTDLAVSGHQAPLVVVAGGVLTYHVTISNNGPGNAPAMVYSDTVPAYTTFESITASGWTCTTPAVGGTGSIQCTRTVLTPGTSAEVTLAVRVSHTAPAGALIVHTVDVSSSVSELNAANNRSTVTTQVGPRLYLPSIMSGGGALSRRASRR